jgi:MFS family permease
MRQSMPPRPVLVVSLVVALSLLGDSMLYTVLPVQYELFGLPVGAVGLLLSVNRYVRLVSNTLAGRLYNRNGMRLPFLGAVALGAGTTAVYGLGPSLPLFVVARMLWGTSWSLLRLGGQLTVLRYSGVGRLGSGMGAYQGISRLGSLIGMLAGGLLADTIGARAALLLFGAASALGLPLAMTVALNDVHVRVPAARAGRRRPWRNWRALLCGVHHEAAAQVAVVHVAAMWTALAAGLLGSSLGLLFRMRFGMQVEVLGLGMGMATFTGAVLAARWISDLALGPIFGILIDRLGPRVVAAGLTVAAAVGPVILATASQLHTILAGVALAYAGGSGLAVVLDASAGRLALSGERARAMSRYATWWDLGSATGPALGYALLGVFGLPVTYALGSLGLAACMAAYLWIAAPAPRRVTSGATEPSTTS